MVRETSWKWRGNFYDPEMPVSCELHYGFWDEVTERFAPKGLDQFWLRRVDRKLDDISFPALNPVDNLGYSALNVLRDMLRGAPSVQSVYELARFLHTHADNESFWKTRRESHDDSLRRLEAISFRLAFEWFTPRLSEETQQEIDCLPTAVQMWFQEYARSPLTAWFRENKDGVWLHLSLLDSFRNKQSVLRKRLLPTRVPNIERVDVPSPSKKTPAAPDRSWSRRARYCSHMLSRAGTHARILPSTLWRGTRLWWSANTLGKEFCTFFAASILYNFGLCIFFFLYNLYLLDRGFKEDVIGLVTSAFGLGTIIGTIPAGMLAQRIGLRKTLILTFSLVSVVSALRSLPLAEPPLLVLAFFAGAFATIWAVSVLPAVAQLTSEKNRPVGFSIIFSSGIAVGIVGGQAAGHLPGWLEHAGPLITAARAKQEALLIACSIVALATWLVSRLKFTSIPARETKFYPLNPFLLRYLPAMAVWTLALGAVSPFFNVYFSQYLRMPVKQIGTVFSISYVSQAVTVLAAPVIFRKCGLVTGIMYMQIATAVALGCLAAIPGASGAVPVYIAYISFQWMSQPGMLSLLMNQVAPSERTGASALNFLVSNASHAIAAAAAGVSLVRFGYPAVMKATACIALIAAFSFRLLLGRNTLPVPQSSPTSLGL